MDYAEKINLENKRKLQILLNQLPAFCSDFFRYLDIRNTSSRTRLSYLSKNGHARYSHKGIG